MNSERGRIFLFYEDRVLADINRIFLQRMESPRLSLRGLPHPQAATSIYLRHTRESTSSWFMAQSQLKFASFSSSPPIPGRRMPRSGKHKWRLRDTPSASSPTLLGRRSVCWLPGGMGLQMEDEQAAETIQAQVRITMLCIARKSGTPWRRRHFLFQRGTSFVEKPASPISNSELRPSSLARQVLCKTNYLTRDMRTQSSL